MASETTLLDGNLMLRMNKKRLEDFQKHCSENLKRPYQDIVREMIDATLDGRLKIQPTKEQKIATGELYDPGK